MLLKDEGQQASLIETQPDGFDNRPLAERLRPQTITEFVGQAHLLAADKPLARLAALGHIHSMVLWGPPGTGKTTLARLLAVAAEMRLISLSAVLAGVKEIREAVKEATHFRSQGEGTVLFVDEVHRFNKAQQDALLPHVEQGTVTFIGATTENPSFEVNAALLSRARVYVLRSLSHDDLNRVAKRGVDLLQTGIDSEATDILVDFADGDARRLLNVLEIAVQLTDGEIDASVVLQAVGERVRRFDKGGDVFYEQISALHKSVRGSSPDAALYWFCRMLDGGADPRYIGRRLIRMASEEIGNSDPRALQISIDALASFERLGSPEGELALAQAVLYLASVPKSNAVYEAFNRAMQYVRESPSYAVPMHLRNAPTEMMKNMGYGGDYRYAHNEESSEGAYAAGEDYFPQEMAKPEFYVPLEAGLESKIKARLQRLATLDRNATQGRATEPKNAEGMTVEGMTAEGMTAEGKIAEPGRGDQ